MPLSDIREGIDADEQEELVRFLERLLQPPDGIDGVVGFGGVRLRRTRFLNAGDACVKLIRRFKD
jgi:hypothetical protein